MMGFLFVLLLSGLVAVGLFGIGGGPRSEPTASSRRNLTEAEAIEGLKARYLNGEIDLAEFEAQAEQIYADGPEQVSSGQDLNAPEGPEQPPRSGTSGHPARRSGRGGHGCRR